MGGSMWAYGKSSVPHALARPKDNMTDMRSAMLLTKAEDIYAVAEMVHSGVLLDAVKLEEDEGSDDHA
jgi:hypothetical protein